MKIWRYIPHLPQPDRMGPIDGFVCRLCGSRASRVQLKGQKKYNDRYSARHRKV